MPNVFVVLGGTGVRKSFTIRALTGAYNRDVYDVGHQNGTVLNVFVQISALQESRINPQQFINEINTNVYQNVLVGLWIDQSRGQPNGLSYINDFIQAGWNIQNIVVLGTSQLPYPLPASLSTPTYINNSSNMPANSIASQIRPLWSWL